MKNKILITIVSILTLIILGSCTGGSEIEKTVIKVSGSNSVESLSKAFSEAFSKNASDIRVEVQGGGSGAAIKNVESGIADAGNLSRPLSDDEKTKGLVETIIAIDGISLIVHKDNGVSDITTDNLIKVFNGEIKNWKEIGGDDQEIVVIGREAGSGTRDGFESTLNIKEKTKYTIELNETGQIKTQVGNTKGAIGYISTGYVDSTVKGLKVDGVEANTETINKKEYKIQRPFIVVTKKDASEKVKSFINFIISTEGQKIVSTKGFIPVN